MKQPKLPKKGDMFVTVRPAKDCSNGDLMPLFLKESGGTNIPAGEHGQVLTRKRDGRLYVWLDEFEYRYLMPDDIKVTGHEDFTWM